MSWVAISPQPLDFCGRPPCPRCFNWKEGDKPPLSGLYKMALDLLQKPLDDLSADQRKELNGVARKMHKGGLQAFASPPDELPPPDGTTDIGMSETRALEGWLKERRRIEPPKPRVLTLDEIYARKAQEEAAAKEKQNERDERLKEAREIAAIFAKADRDQNERRQYEEQQLLQAIDPSFVNQCRAAGIYSARDIYERWISYPSFRFDPLRGRYGV